MDSSDYIEVKVSIDPFSEENAEILEAMLSDLPYDSFDVMANARIWLFAAVALTI